MVEEQVHVGVGPGIAAGGGAEQELLFDAEPAQPRQMRPQPGQDGIPFHAKL